MKPSRFLGGVLLVAGTSIGAGMLALPVISSFTGFFPSFLALFLTWLFMYITSILILEVNLAAPGETNLISMAGRTLGAPGRAVCWVIYLLLLYSLTAAYIGGSAPPVLAAIQWMTGKTAPTWLASLPLLALFALFVYLGTRAVDYVNRIFMLGLVITYVALIALLPPHLEWNLLSRIEISAIKYAVPVMFTSFGFHIIIPTLSTYLEYDRKQLRRILFVGSVIPLLVYALWELMILGVVPAQGATSLYSAWEAGETSAAPLAAFLQNPWIAVYANGFSFFAIVTSFLGVSLSLSDFLGDGLKMHRFTWGREIACLLTFLPPLAFALTYERTFLLALEFAGIFVAILLGILPALMAWKLPRYRSKAKRSGLALIVLVSIFVIILDLSGRQCSI